MNSLSSFKSFVGNLNETGELMPVLFVGHGSPMNGIEDNEFSRKWAEIARSIPVPKAVLVVSAHWLTRDTRVTAMDFPKTIHDFGGFPKELFAVEYPAPGDAILAKDISSTITSVHVHEDHEWGLDHGAWTVVRHMYPDANIPVLQLSIDYTKGADYHYNLGKELLALRRKGVLIMGSGNMVHNLRMVAWDKLSDNSFGYDWALDLNEKFKTLISSAEHKSLVNYESLGGAVKLAIPTPDHYFPLLYSLGLQTKKDNISFFNDRAVGGSLTMTSVLIGGGN